MDLYCSRCGEPYELFYVTDEMTPEERSDFNSGQGCPSCKGKEVKEKPFRSKLATVMRSMLGDDIDGLAAEMEDAEALMGPAFWE